MLCRECGKQIEDDSKFCVYCKEQVKIYEIAVNEYFKDLYQDGSPLSFERRVNEIAKLGFPIEIVEIDGSIVYNEETLSKLLKARFETSAPPASKPVDGSTDESHVCLTEQPTAENGNRKTAMEADTIEKHGRSSTSQKGRGDFLNIKR